MPIPDSSIFETSAGLSVGELFFSLRHSIVQKELHLFFADETLSSPGVLQPRTSVAGHKLFRELLFSSRCEVSEEAQRGSPCCPDEKA